jgi:MATE family multidrug resistance protein
MTETRGELVRLAWPIAVAMLGDTAMGLVDAKLVAGLGSSAIAGVGIGVTLLYLAQAVTFGFLRGVKVRTAHAVGEGRPHDGARYAEAGLVVAIALGLATFVLSRDVSPALAALGIDHAAVGPAREFLAARTFGTPAAFALQALIQHRQGLGDARSPMVAGLLANVVNGPLAWALIGGHLGLPALGVSGAGYGTAIAEWVAAALMATLFLGQRARSRRPDVALGAALSEVTSLGGPTAAQFGLEMLAFTTFTTVLGGIRASEVAAHQIALAVCRTSFLPGMAVGEAGSVLVGKALGARKLDEADRVTRSALLLATGFMSLCGLGFALFGRPIARAFTTDVEVAAIAGRVLLVAAVFQTLDAVTMVLRSALRGARDVRVVAVVGVLCAWGCVPTSAYVLGKLFGLGAVGGWLGFVLETALAAAILWRRWSRGSWRDAYSPRPVPSDGSALATLALARPGGAATSLTSRATSRVVPRSKGRTPPCSRSFSASSCRPPRARTPCPRCRRRATRPRTRRRSSSTA